jgi:hypothetical protein
MFMHICFPLGCFEAYVFHTSTTLLLNIQYHACSDSIIRLLLLNQYYN